jgi:hypothetical protein
LVRERKAEFRAAKVRALGLVGGMAAAGLLAWVLAAKRSRRR